MQLALELLAPAKNKDIGIAAVSCGADAVYMAGPSFGAREAAGNTMDDVAETVRYAHRFGAKVYLTVNTILYDNELAEAEVLIREAVRAGVDALIVQDLAVLKMDIPPIPLFASTQCDIRTPEKARLLESLGFVRLILARELSLEQIRSIRSAVLCDLEFFVHGALCVSYSGQCYLSRRLTGRSANRGACAQACRSLYDLEDGDGKVLQRGVSLLSLKDLRLDGRIPDLVAAGITSFKIEGRLKNASYVKNVVRHYSDRLDEFIAAHPESYRRASYGKLYGGFKPDVDATFNRGYTEFNIDGVRGDWNSADAARSTGEYLGTVSGLRRDVRDGTMSFYVRPEGGSEKVLSNGDGLMFAGESSEESVGMRADTVQDGRITVKGNGSVREGAKVYRNLNVAFEKELEKNMPRRFMDVEANYRTEGGVTSLEAVCEDGTATSFSFAEKAVEARNPQLAAQSLRVQLSKSALDYMFRIGKVEADKVYFYPASEVNGWRRRLAEALASAGGAGRRAAEAAPAPAPEGAGGTPAAFAAALPPHLSFLANCSNRLSEAVLGSCGAVDIDPAYELAPVPDAQVMRCKYCIRAQAGVCLKKGGDRIPSPLYLVNNGRRIRLEFDCRNCEMLVFL